MKTRTFIAWFLMAVATISGVFVIAHSRSVSALSATSTLSPRRPTAKQIQEKLNAKEVRLGIRVEKRAERLKQTSKGFRNAVKHFEERGFKPLYSAGVSAFFEKPKQHHARRGQDMEIIRDGDGDPPPNTNEISYFSYDSPPEKWIGIEYSTLNGTPSIVATEMLINGQIVESLSAVKYDNSGNVTDRWYNADYYNLEPWGYYSQPAGYYDSLAAYGFCVSGCSSATLFQIPRPSPGPTPKIPVSPTPTPTPWPNPRPTPGPGQIGDCPTCRANNRCLLANCIGMVFGCSFSGPAFAGCSLLGCGPVNLVMCEITNPVSPGRNP
jgi:hypothetical protein